MQGPISWYGGKRHMVRKLLKLIPPHRTYVEVFGGGAQLLFAKEPSPIEVYNDIDSRLVNFFRVLRDDEKFERFLRKVALTPVSREEYHFCRETLDDCEDDVERAYRFYVAARQSFSGNFATNGWNFAKTHTTRGMSSVCAKWLSAIELLPEIHARLMRVQIEHYDFRKIFAIYDDEETFFYCDPPYVAGTRKSPDVYKHEMNDKDHEDLVEILLNIKGMALLSGYNNDIYRRLEESGWKRIDYELHAMTVNARVMGGTKPKRTESVWICPNNFKTLPLEEALHGRSRKL